MKKIVNYAFILCMIIGSFHSLNADRSSQHIQRKKSPVLLIVGIVLGASLVLNGLDYLYNKKLKPKPLPVDRKPDQQAYVGHPTAQEKHYAELTSWANRVIAYNNRVRFDKKQGKKSFAPMPH